jgi:hypothetical protein
VAQIFHLNLANLVLWASPRSRLRGSEFNALVGKDCEQFWSTGDEPSRLPDENKRITLKRGMLPYGN